MSDEIDRDPSSPLTFDLAHMPLDHLRLHRLEQLAKLLILLADTGTALQAEGVEPIYDLTPGQPVRMTLSARMPSYGAPGIDVQADDGPPAAPPALAKLMRDHAQCCNADGSFSFPSTETEPAGLAEPGGATPEAGNPSPVPVVAKAPAPVPPPTPAAAGGDGPTGAEPATKGAPWTDDEDARAVQLVAQWIDTGMTKGAAIAAAAAELGRPAPGLEFRLKTKLREALAAELDREAPADPATENDPELDPLAAHLAARPMKGWTLADDANLMELAEMNWAPPEIAVELGRPGDAIKARFDLLTGLDSETKTRRFARADVAARLTQLRAEYEAGAAA